MHSALNLIARCWDKLMDLGIAACNRGVAYCDRKIAEEQAEIAANEAASE